MLKNKCKSLKCKNERFSHLEIVRVNDSEIEEVLQSASYCIFHLQHPQTINLWFCENCLIEGVNLKKVANYNDKITLCEECQIAWKDYMAAN